MGIDLTKLNSSVNEFYSDLDVQTQVRSFYSKLDGNARLNPLIGRIRFNNLSVERIVNVAIPFFNLYQPTAIGLGVCLGAVKSWQIIADLRTSYHSRDWTVFSKTMLMGAFMVSSVALSILMPTAGLILSNGVQLAIDVHVLAQAVWKGNSLEALQAIFRIAHTSIYVAAAVYALPELIALSILMQAGLELYRSGHHFAKGEFLEGFANLALALIRAHKAAPHVQTVHRNWCGKRLTQDEWDAMLMEISPASYLKLIAHKMTVEEWHERMKEMQSKKQDGIRVDIESILKKKYYSNFIDHIDIKISDSNIDFKNLRFTHCNFNYQYYNDTAFVNTTFKKCSFVGTEFFNSLFAQGNFNQSNLSQAVFYQCMFQRFKWLKSDLTDVCFNDSVFSHTVFSACKLFQTSFFGAQVSDSRIKDSDLTDALLLHTKDFFKISGGIAHTITKPVVAMPWVLRYAGSMRGIARQQTKDFESIILPVIYNENDPKAPLLDKEVNLLLQKIQQDKPHDLLSLPAEILKRSEKGSQIAHLRDKINALFAHVDGIFLPGGADIEPELYGHLRGPETGTYDHYERSMLECAMLNLAREKTIPAIGICRGSQMGNVFFGGTLKQHVEDQWNEQDLKPVNTDSEAFQWLKDIIGEGVYGDLMHHQASDIIGKGLTTVLEYAGVPKAIISQDGNFLFTQFHPEMYNWLEKKADQEQNKAFLGYFFSRVKACHDAKKA